MPKHDAHAIVASFDSQYWQSGESDEIAAPQFGQFNVSAFISVAPRGLSTAYHRRADGESKSTGRPRVSQAIWIVSLNEMGLLINEIEEVRRSTKLPGIV